ncbi:MAG TPA: DinB family protein [Acidimicrobiia bacterium]
MTTNPSPNPVSQPSAYQQSLLAALGERDPATVQAQTLASMRQLATDAGGLLSTRPEPGEWAVLGCLAHLVDAEIVMSSRYRWVLAEDQPAIQGYDQDFWVDNLHPDDEPADELLSTFGPLRAANLRLWQRSGEAERARVGLHSERGPESYDLMFRMIAGHDLVHLAQARDALAAARRR